MVLSDPIEVLVFLAGAALWLKKLAEMERYQSLRVFVLTTILSCIVLYFTVQAFTFDYPVDPDPTGDHFTLTEM